MTTSGNTQPLPFPPFSNRFLTLGEDFFARVKPSPVKSPNVIATNKNLAKQLQFNPEFLTSDVFRDIFCGNQIAINSEPVASIYSGHQFGIWAGQLGDGRAILLGELADKNNARFELQMKGSGMTPFSRMGDGRAVLRSSIREYLCSEAMAALNIPSSRALCLIGADDYVMREQPEKIAVVTRVAESFIRFGSFEHWYYNGQTEQLKTLADFVIQHHYPEFLEAENPYRELLENIVIRTADLMANWQAVGFMHGVMNTDNMSILGITLDYGPFGFMEAYDPEHICNHTDTQGRYAYKMQPRIGQWNCHALAQALLPLIGDIDTTQAALSVYVARFEKTSAQLMRKKFGFKTEQNLDSEIFTDFFDILQEGQTDFTLAFRYLSQYSKAAQSKNESLRDLFINRDALDQWLKRYQQRLQLENSDDVERQTAMNSVNPKYILRNYLAQQAIEKAEQNDFSEVHKLLSILEQPYAEQIEHEAYAALPPDWARSLSVSCSS
jgi:uncharacterized protein YdiU (UPF0061 family)